MNIQFLQEKLRSQRTAKIEIELDLPRLTEEERKNLKPALSIDVPYSEIKLLDTNRFFYRIQSISSKPSDLQNRFFIRFYGYPNEDGRHVSENESIRKWARKLYNQVPHLFFYLSDFQDYSQTIFLCLADVPYFMVRNKEINRYYLNENRDISVEIYNNAISYSNGVHNEYGLALEKKLRKILSPFLVLNK